ncbi:hypothetical protein DBR34_06910 [Stenotrophomonas sp. HMWF003]|nr:hypothetical protein DBR34_06910 [Stenotrophomonas sp. HMWF003]
MRAIALLQLNSAYGSCRVRSWAASVLDAGNIGLMFQGWAVLDLDGQPGRTQTCVNQKNSRRAPSTQGDSRGNRLSGRYCAGGDSLPMRASLPVAGMY